MDKMQNFSDASEDEDDKVRNMYCFIFLHSKSFDIYSMCMS